MTWTGRGRTVGPYEGRTQLPAVWWPGQGSRPLRRYVAVRCARRGVSAAARDPAQRRGPRCRGAPHACAAVDAVAAAGRLALHGGGLRRGRPQRRPGDRRRLLRTGPARRSGRADPGRRGDGRRSRRALRGHRRPGPRAVHERREAAPDQSARGRPPHPAVARLPHPRRPRRLRRRGAGHVAVGGDLARTGGPAPVRRAGPDRSARGGRRTGPGALRRPVPTTAPPLEAVGGAPRQRP
ncbi:hypothetical protein SGPA1_11981 [Streptomyces misionensis JCM 4497]